ncbi:hypothetical protein N7450_010088 [Penicillium hetheringtonii]|uniref:CENP-V/GFA domain-containing protein n=1 Tax=Penicillium hetheringtonii TaxID=911720 RepID=A0AAD6DCE4_9EURO|nr:hypothetical protein N7450_010088 [Penicillium hetheringtonii]
MGANMLTGSCLCALHRYTIAKDDIIRKITCSCARCRKISGGYKSTNFVIPKNKLKLTSTPTWHSFVPSLSHGLMTFNAVLENDRHGHICFCRRCGSMIYREAEVEGFRNLVFVPVGSLDDIDSISDLKEEEWYSH